MLENRLAKMLQNLLENRLQSCVKSMILLSGRKYLVHSKFDFGIKYGKKRKKSDFKSRLSLAFDHV